VSVRDHDQAARPVGSIGPGNRPFSQGDCQLLGRAVCLLPSQKSASHQQCVRAILWLCPPFGTACDWAQESLSNTGGARGGARGCCRSQVVSAAQLRVTDETAWRRLRQQLEYRHEARRMQLRFRRNPDAYLTGFEQRLLTPVE
jgi:hypothetical protein